MWGVPEMSMTKTCVHLKTGTVLWAWHKNFPICIYKFQEIKCCDYETACFIMLNYENCDMKTWQWNEYECMSLWLMKRNGNVCKVSARLWHENKCNENEKWCMFEMKWIWVHAIMIDEKKWKWIQSVHANMSWQLWYEKMRNEMEMNAWHYDWWKEMEMYAKCMCVYGMRIIAMEMRNEMRNDMESVWEIECMQRNGNVRKVYVWELLQWKWEMKWEMIWKVYEKLFVYIWHDIEKWNISDVMFEMRMQWLWYDNVWMTCENKKWNEYENGMWTVIETECNGYDMNRCTMVCVNEMWTVVETEWIDYDVTMWICVLYMKTTQGKVRKVYTQKAEMGCAECHGRVGNPVGNKLKPCLKIFLSE